MTTQYFIAKSYNAELLTEIVQEKLNEGWELSGGVSVTNGGTIIFAQALTLKQ